MSLQPGVYKHFKGNLYQVIGVARHSESEEQLVVYKTLYGDHSLWVRPLGMFTEMVECDGRQVARFEFIETVS
jgi:hypothetical protein